MIFKEASLHCALIGLQITSIRYYYPALSGMTIRMHRISMFRIISTSFSKVNIMPGKNNILNMLSDTVIPLLSTA